MVEGPIFIEPGLYNLFIEVHTVGTTRTQIDPALKYDVWVTPGREEAINISEDGQTQQVVPCQTVQAEESNSFCGYPTC